MTFAIAILTAWALYAAAVQIDFWLLHTDAILNSTPDWLDRDILTWSGIYASVFATVLALIRLHRDRTSRRNAVVLAAASALVFVELSLPFALYKLGSPRCCEGGMLEAGND